MPAKETVLPEWAERRASSRDEAVGVARPKRSRGLSQGGSKGEMICMKVTELCQIQQRPGPGFATQGLQDAEDATKG